jgi:hypothetical protein
MALTKKQIMILSIVIPAICGLIGNLITAFGPAILSWGRKPVYANSEVYRDLVSENPSLEDTLAKQLLKRELYYTNRRTEITFKSLNGNILTTEVKNIGTLRNGTMEKQEYEHSVNFNDSTSYEHVIINIPGMPTIPYNKQQLLSYNPQPNTLEHYYKLPKVVIPSHISFTVESLYTVIKPVTQNEFAVVTNRFVNGPATFSVKNEILDPKFTYEISSLTFDQKLMPTVSPDGKEETIALSGPLFSGQGISISFDYR